MGLGGRALSDLAYPSGPRVSTALLDGPLLRREAQPLEVDFIGQTRHAVESRWGHHRRVTWTVD